MFIQKAALRRIPSWAVVDETAVESLETALSADDSDLQQTLDRSFREMERDNPELANYLAEEIGSGNDEVAQSAGYFLMIATYLAFREAFPRRMKRLDKASIDLASETLEFDQALRVNDPHESLESDDVLYAAQPALVGFMQHHFEDAIAQAGEEAHLASFDKVYRALLVEIIALSDAVTPPAGVKLEHALA